MNDAFVKFCREQNWNSYLSGIIRIFACVIFQELVSDKCLWSILDLSEGIRKANEIKQS